MKFDDVTAKIVLCRFFISMQKDGQADTDDRNNFFGGS